MMAESNNPTVIQKISTPYGDLPIDYRALANKNHAADHSLGAPDEITPADIGAAGKSIKTSAVISRLLWTRDGSTGPYKQTIDIIGVKPDSIVEISLPPNVSESQIIDAQALNLQDGGQEENAITLLAYGVLNTVDISINVVIRGDL